MTEEFPVALGPLPNQLGVGGRRHLLIGAPFGLAVLWGLGAISFAKGSNVLGLLAFALEVTVALGALLVVPRVEGDPTEFSVGRAGIVLRYDYPGLHRDVRVQWSTIQVREWEQPGPEHRVTLTIRQTATVPRSAILDLDRETFKAVSSLNPPDVRRF